MTAAWRAHRGACPGARAYLLVLLLVSIHIAVRLIENYQFPPTHLKALSDGTGIQLLSL